MKKRMKFTAVFASAALLCGNCLTGYAADALHYFGIMEGDTFQQMQVLDDKGTFRNWRVLKNGTLGNVTADTAYYVCTCHNDELTDTSDPEYYIWADSLYLAVPAENKLAYVLRSDIDSAEAAEQAKEIVQNYFPDKNPYEYMPRSYQVTEQDETARTAELSNSLMRDLAQAGLISEFYTWGGTAKYIQIDHGFLTVYNPSSWNWAKKTYDWTEIEAWVNEHHPECEFVCITDKESALAKTLGIGPNPISSYMQNGDTFYAVIPPEGTEFSDHFSLAIELFEQFDLDPYAFPTPYEDEHGPMTGQNALAIAGDANLDCSVDVADAVLVARFASEDKEAAITDQGKENADVAHDGNVDDQDAMKILQYIAKKISYEELSADFDPNSVSVPKSTTNDSGSVDNNESENTPTNEVTDSSVLVPIRRTEPKPLTVSEESNKRTCMFREASDEDLALFDDAATVFDRSAYTLICAEISGDFSDAMIVKCISKEGICRTLIAFPYDLNNSAGPHTITYLLAFPKELNIHAEQFQAIWDGLLGTKTVTPQEEFQVLLSDASESIPYISLDRP